MVFGASDPVRRAGDGKICDESGLLRGEQHTRQPDGERRARPRLALHGDVPAQQPAELAGERQPEPRAAVAGARSRLRLGDAAETFVWRGPRKRSPDYGAKRSATGTLKPGNTGSPVSMSPARSVRSSASGRDTSTVRVRGYSVHTSRAPASSHIRVLRRTAARRVPGETISTMRSGTI